MGLFVVGGKGGRDDDGDGALDVFFLGCLWGLMEMWCYDMLEVGMDGRRYLGFVVGGDDGSGESCDEYLALPDQLVRRRMAALDCICMSFPWLLYSCLCVFREGLDEWMLWRGFVFLYSWTGVW